MVSSILFFSSSAQTDSNQDDLASLHLTMVIHLEGWPFNQGEEVLERYSEIVLGYTDLFDTYGAKITFETADSVDAILAAEGRHNFLAELQERGHAIGVHADIGGRPGWTQTEFENTLREMRQKQLGLGINVRHVSGILDLPRFGGQFRALTSFH